MFHICVWGQRAGFKDSKQRGEANIMQDGAVDIQHGTGVDGNFYTMHPRLLFPTWLLTSEDECKWF
jgi:hypothetical protein